MRVQVDCCQIIGMKDTNNNKSAFNRCGTLAKPLIASILTAFLLVVGLAEVMGDSHVSPRRDSGAISGLITPATAPAPESTTVVLLGISLVGLAGADVRCRWKRKQLIKANSEQSGQIEKRRR